MPGVLGTLNKNRPSPSVAPPTVVPFSITDAYGNASPVMESVTTPLICVCCARAVHTTIRHTSQSIVFFLITIFFLLFFYLVNNLITLCVIACTSVRVSGAYSGTGHP